MKKAQRKTGTHIDPALEGFACCLSYLCREMEVLMVCLP